MKLLIHSNGPTVKTGYGVQVALLVDRLVEDGHEVAVSATYGQPGGAGVGTWTCRNGTTIPVYPSYQLVSGEDMLGGTAAHFFAGDQDGWIIPLLDMWSFGLDRECRESIQRFNVAAWTPVDHDPVPPIVSDQLKRLDCRVIAMSRHGQAELVNAGIDADYIPLAVDTKLFRPLFEVEIEGRTVNARQFLNLPRNAFVVGLCGMNKDPNDRKGFQEAFTAFARFQASHPDAILFLHTEMKPVQGGLNLIEVAYMAGVPPEAIRFSSAYAYAVGQNPSLMPLMYTAFDVLLSPSAGEGFCVPLIEAQACGVPVIASDFTAQPELVGAGWTVSGQKIWDGPSHSWYQRANVSEIVAALEEAYDSDFGELAVQAQEFAKQYDVDYVYDTYWRPYLKTLDLRPPADKPKMERVAVLVPAMKRPQNVKRLVDSFFDTTRDPMPWAELFYVLDDDDADQIEAVTAAGAKWLPATRGASYAGKINAGYEQTTEFDWIFACGDDVEFTPGWLEAARELSDRYDVIGTNDSEPGRVRNPLVAEGKHADHFFMRRTYCQNPGGSLEADGLPMPERYYHWFTDKEVIQLAKARGVFAPCLESRVIHHHPGYDGREDLRQADPVYMKAVEFGEMDRIAFSRVAGLIDQHKVVRKDIWS